MAEKFVHPEVFQGDTVLWYKDGNKSTKPFTALVSAIGEKGVLSLVLVTHGSDAISTRMGVKHIDDPDMKDIERKNFGGWDHTERIKRLYRQYEAKAPAKSAAAKE